MQIRFEYLINGLDQIAQEESHRWRDGQCAEFAIALAELLVEHGIYKDDDLCVLIGTRSFYDPDFDKEQYIFSHAVLCIESGSDIFQIDYMGLNACEKWEEEFAIAGYQFENENSDFSWEAIDHRDRQAISKHIFEIDGSRSIQEHFVTFAKNKIIAFGADFFANPYSENKVKMKVR